MVKCLNLTLCDGQITRWNHREIANSAASKTLTDLVLRVALNDGSVVEGEWEIKDRQSQEVLRLKLDFETDDPPLVWIKEDWEIVDFSEVRIEMQGESETEGFEKMLTIEKL